MLLVVCALTLVFCYIVPYWKATAIESVAIERYCPGGGGGGGVMPCICHTETCRRSGYTFRPSNQRQGVFFRA